MDKTHNETDKILKSIEKAIKEEYQKAYTEIRKQMADIISKMQLTGDFQERFNLSMKYDRLNSLSKRCSEIIKNASKQAIKTINDNTGEIYKINYNYMANEFNFPVLSKKISEKIVKGEVNPYTKIAEMKLKNIDSIITKFETEMLNGFANGEGVQKLTKRIKNVLEINTKDSQRIARTESTRIENQARNDVGSIGKEKYGLNMWKRWVATGDERTRDDHLEMDGVEVPEDEPFILPDGSEVMFPGDSSLGADASEIINCRCTVVYFVKD